MFVSFLPSYYCLSCPFLPRLYIFFIFLFNLTSILAHFYLGYIYFSSFCLTLTYYIFSSLFPSIILPVFACSPVSNISFIRQYFISAIPHTSPIVFVPAFQFYAFLFLAAYLLAKPHRSGNTLFPPFFTHAQYFFFITRFFFHPCFIFFLSVYIFSIILYTLSLVRNIVSCFFLCVLFTPGQLFSLFLFNLCGFLFIYLYVIFNLLPIRHRPVVFYRRHPSHLFTRFLVNILSIFVFFIDFFFTSIYFLRLSTIP